MLSSQPQLVLRDVNGGAFAMHADDKYLQRDLQLQGDVYLSDGTNLYVTTPGLRDVLLEESDNFLQANFLDHVGVEDLDVFQTSIFQAPPPSKAALALAGLKPSDRGRGYQAEIAGVDDRDATVSPLSSEGEVTHLVAEASGKSSPTQRSDASEDNWGLGSRAATDEDFVSLQNVAPSYASLRQNSWESMSTALLTPSSALLAQQHPSIVSHSNGLPSRLPSFVSTATNMSEMASPSLSSQILADRSFSSAKYADEQFGMLPRGVFPSSLTLLADEHRFQHQEKLLHHHEQQLLAQDRLIDDLLGPPLPPSASELQLLDAAGDDFLPVSSMIRQTSRQLPSPQASPLVVNPAQQRGMGRVLSSVDLLSNNVTGSGRVVPGTRTVSGIGLSLDTSGWGDMRLPPSASGRQQPNHALASSNQIKKVHSLPSFTMGPGLHQERSSMPTSPHLAADPAGSKQTFKAPIGYAQQVPYSLSATKPSVGNTLPVISVPGGGGLFPLVKTQLVETTARGGRAPVSQPADSLNVADGAGPMPLTAPNVPSLKRSAPSGGREANMPKARKRANGASPRPPAPNPNGLSCTQCGTQTTPVWRAGPHGPKTLCNACGVRYMKVVKKK